MRIIGLTGGIASGKSTVGAILRDLGAPVIDADALARRVVERGQPALAAIVRRFGAEVLQSDGSLNRKALGEIVFSDEGARRDLEAITHPLIRQAYLEAVEKLVREGHEVAVYDVPLLFEGKLDKTVDLIWVVYVPREMQLERLIGRDGLSREEAEKRLKAQMPLEEKAHRADQVIDNQGSLANLREIVQNLWNMALGLVI